MLARIHRRFGWYRVRFQINNPFVGRAVELLGNKVRMDGLIYSVDCPNITTGHKSTLAFGLHEMEERSLVGRWLPADVPVLELGGGLGVVSCLANRKLNDPSQHIVVEANPAMIPVLERNRDLNKCKFRIVNKAIGYAGDSVELNLDDEFVGSSLTGTGAKIVTIATTNITELIGEFNQVGIVCDIEGTEAEIIKLELPRLGERVRYFMAEMHPAVLGKDVVNSLLNDLVSLGFALKEQHGDSVFYGRP